jgi:hypothetical protein
MSKIVQKYFNPELPGSFLGVSGFLKNNPEFKNSKDLRKTLRSLPANTLHKPIRYKFPRNKIIVPGIDYQWQIDLIDLTNISGSNFNHKFILTCIDVFSKKAWAIALLNKSSASCKSAFEKILKDGRKPKYIYADSGNEFKGDFLEYLKSLEIQIILTKSSKKASVVERFNRTLKEKMFRYFDYIKYNTETNLQKKRYIDVLDKFLYSYNNSIHRSIKMTPNEVNNKNEKQVFINLYGFDRDEGDDRYIKIKYKVGTYVRLIKNKTIFEKGYTAKWIDKTYIISKIIAKVPVVYELKDLNNNEIEGQYYTEELQRVELPFDTYLVHDELPNNKILIEKINSSESEKQIIDKNDFIANRLRSRKK